MRRFLDSHNKEAGKKLDYKQEVLNVIASLLRVEKCGELQKTLADSLSYSTSLMDQDLQYVNLQNAYIKPRQSNRRIYMNNCDLYMADLSYASLNRIDAKGIVLYNANLFKTVFRDCSLIDANFSNADLLNTSFKGCDLEGALFAGATNIPDNIRCKLDKKGVYRSDLIESQYINNDSSKMVFVSCIGNLNPHQKDCINYISNHLKSHNITPIRYCREDYRSSGQINVIRGEMSKCKGVIIIGFKSIVINSAIYRPNTGDMKELKDICVSTPWNGIEAGMACALGLPILLINECEISDGIFDESINDKNISRISLVDIDANFNKDLNQWLQILQ